MGDRPSPGSRVSVRYRIGSVLTDVIGILEVLAPEVSVRPKAGGVVRIPPADVVSMRELSAVPVRASEIRALEHAAALAWPGTEQHWHRGWLLRAGGGYTARANSAVPLEFSSGIAALPEIIDWYAERGLPAWLALPERLSSVREIGVGVGVKQTRVMVADLAPGSMESVRLEPRPNDDWLTIYERDVPSDVLGAVVDGEVAFAELSGSAVGRGAVTPSPDGTRWLGISALHVVPGRRRRGLARDVCVALQNWGTTRGATRSYVQVLVENAAAIALYESLGYRLHHHLRYVDARALAGRSL